MRENKLRWLGCVSRRVEIEVLKVVKEYMFKKSGDEEDQNRGVGI